MTLLDPRALTLLALIPLLVLLHVRRRRRAWRVPMLALWRPGPETGRPRIRLRRVRRRPLLLALRVLLLTSLAVALARPVSTWSRFGGGRSIVFVFDSSASMGATEGGRSRFALAQERSLALLDTLRRSDRVQLVQAGPRPWVVSGFLGDRHELREKVRRLRPFDTGADLAAALHLARSVSGEGATDHVFLFGDAAAESSIDAAIPWLTFVRVGEPAANVGISRISPRPSRISPWDHDLLVEVVNRGPRREVPLSVLDGERILFETVLWLDANDTRSVVVPGLTPATGVLVARLEVTDSLTVDNRAWAVVPPARPRSVLLAAHGSRYLEAALTADSLLTAWRAPSSGDAAGSAPEPDLVIVDRSSGVVAAGSARLVFVRPTDGGRRGPQTLEVAATARDHPVVAWAGLAPIAVTRVAELAPAAGDRVLLTAGQRPVVIAREGGGRELVVGLDPADPVWTGSLSFPLFVANAVRWLTDSGEARGRQFAAGETLVWDLPTGVTADSVRGREPGGGRLAMVESGGRLLIGPALRAGLHTVTGPGFAELLAVNLGDASESDLGARADSAPLEAGHPLPARGRGTAASGVEIGRQLLFLALLLFAAERWIDSLAGRSLRRRPLASGPAAVRWRTR